MLGQVRLYSWTGCPAAYACYHERKDGRRSPLCRACDKFQRRMSRKRSKGKL
jgi:hypothetical protein